MGYFDSSKNRALWEIELQNLRKLRAERMAGKQVKAEPTVETQIKTQKEPVRMTYQELLKEETAAAQKKASKKERQNAMEREKESRQKEARAYEKS